MQIFTIGHSTHTQGAFLRMLQLARIRTLIDIRSFPGSRKFPWISKEALSVWLPEAAIEYDRIPELGGRRNKSQEIAAELNAGWNNQSFHNYADHTLSRDFQKGINKLQKFAANKRTAYFCSERHPARCHRLLISNALAARGWEVEHIIYRDEEQIEFIQHQLGQWGAMPIMEEDGTVVYPRI